ncbi:MAG: patatin-like phospholipase family protein [Pseudomonadota bacterium]
MAKGSGRQAHHTKAINLALQGGGSHGAFTWGVLDRMFEEDALWIEAISGTSAGAMNAVVAAQGMYDDGAAGARVALEAFWHKISVAGQSSPIKRTPLDVWMGSWSLDNSPGYVMMDLVNRMASPYDLNPLGINPLRDLVEDFIDFRKIAGEEDMGLFISATNVETGRARVFHRHEITLDVVMASACLPQLFKAVEIDGVPYWDGGYMGNPVLFPFIDHSPSPDILIVQINPLKRPGTPTRARDIQNRINEITFNGSLLRDLRAIDLVDRLLDEGALKEGRYRKMYLHMIDGCDDMLELEASSKMNSEWAFLTHLRDIGRHHADRWLTQHFADIEERSTLILSDLFDGPGTAPKPPTKAKPKAKAKPASNVRRLRPRQSK